MQSTVSKQAPSIEGVTLSAPEDSRPSDDEIAERDVRAAGRWRRNVERLGTGLLIAVLLILAGVVSGHTSSVVSQSMILIGAAMAVAVAALALRQKAEVLSRLRLEERIERLEDLRWQAQDNAIHLQSLLDGQRELIIERDPAGRIRFANRQFCRRFGLSADMLEGRQFHPRILARETTGSTDEAGDLPAWARPALECLETVDGPRWIEWTHRSVIQDGPEGFVQTIGHDVTEQRHNERSLAAARDEARAADRAKSRFLASMSHEIRTPMNGIMGMTGLLSETEQSPEQRTYTEVVRKSAATLLALIDEILDFSKIEAGHLQLVEKPFDILDSLQGVVELLSPRAHEKGLQLAWSLAPDLPRAFIGDETRVRQILINLIGNAIKFTDTGGVTVWMGAETTDEGADLVRIVVRDTGPGLTDEARSRIFREFERAVPENATHEGTGLGLAIARRLAMSMGGDIAVASEIGKGATFKVAIQLKRNQDVVDRLSAKNVASRSVALVSSKTLERRVIANFLRSNDARVFEAETVADFSQAHTDFEWRVDTILFDCDVSPQEAGELLKSIGHDRPMTAAVMGAAENRAVFEEFRAAGVSNYLVRPVRPTTLLALLSGTVDRPALGALPTRDDVDGQADQRLSWRVLVAEDNEINALLARTVLTRMGCAPTVVGNGQEAIRAVSGMIDGECEPFDVILMDLHMPGVDGFEATSEIRSRCAAAGIPVPVIVAVTANAFQEDRDRCLEAGMDEYLSKPFEPSDLKRVLKSVEHAR